MAYGGSSRVEKGETLYRRACEIIPGGTQTNAKKPPEVLRGVYPPFIVRGEGAYVWDLDGNRYIDHKLGCGPVILGHAYPSVTEAAARQLREGLVFGSAHPLEVTLAELLTEVIPCAEMARFLKSGAEGTAAAVRVARTYTGRELVLSCGYHGWHDWSLAKNPTIAGIPECLRGLTLDLPYGDYDRLEALFRAQGDKVAAVVFAAPYHVEPAEIGHFLQRVRELTHKHRAVLIYDEIVTGFRVALGGNQQLVGVTPDLAVFSKGMANGFPIAAVTGCKEIMRAWDRTTISTTFGGEAVSIAAAIASITELRDRNVPAELARRGAWLKSQAEQIGVETGLRLRGCGFDALPNILLEGEDVPLADSLQRALLFEGVFPYFPLWYISFAHDMAVMEESAAALRRAASRVVEEKG
ncbi:MAG: aspartate aminotransferase family protein [Anaerolineae bacterium]